MRADMKCDIEISITNEDDQNVETLIVPPCLQDVTFNDQSHESQNGIERVCLPHRYTKLINKQSESVNDVSDDMVSREKDLGIALRWIKQEIRQMKEQDRILTKQFLDLRSTILQLRCMYEVTSSNSDISSMSDSNFSLDDSLNLSQPMNKNLLSLEMETTEFRARTSSLLTPRRSPVTRIKWRSNEYI